MEIQVKQEEGATIVKLEGRLDSVSSPVLDKRLAELVEGGASALILNFAGLSYISSAGLRSILVVSKKMKAQNGRIALTCAQDMVMEVFKMSGFATMLPIYVSDQEALQAR